MSEAVEAVADQFTRRKMSKGSYGLIAAVALSLGTSGVGLVKSRGTEIRDISDRLTTVESDIRHMKEDYDEDSDAIKDMRDKVDEVHEVMVNLRADFRASGISRRDE